MTKGFRNYRRRGKVLELSKAQKKDRTYAPGSKAGRRLFLGVMLLVLVWVVWGWAKGALTQYRLQTVLAQPGRLEAKLSGTAVVAREEKVVYAPISGRVHFLVEEGVRVPVGTVVAEISNRDQTGLGERLAKTRDELETLLQDYVEEKKVLEGRMVSLRRELSGANLALKQAVESGDPVEIRRSRELARRLDGQVDDARERYQELAAQEAALARKLQGLAAASDKLYAQVATEEAGIVTYLFDGWEDRLRVDGLAATEVERVPRNPDPRPNVEEGEVVEAGEPLFKVINPNEVLLALPVQAGSFLGVDTGHEVTLRLKEGEELGAQIWKIQRGWTGSRDLVLLRTARFADLFRVRRSVKVEMVVTGYEGTVLPQGALVTRKGKTGVYIVRKNWAVFLPVEVVGSFGNHVAVKGLNPGTEVITTPGLVSEGMRIR